eukprot:GEZU01021859.1.p1 GENE.GEZU01021859.1~~GEZU01021859.1.p1  ORF type:complete len:905 (+),score=277.98 GEZU01021859.1:97-2811(+)
MAKGPILASTLLFLFLFARLATAVQVGAWKKAKAIGSAPVGREGPACEILGDKMYVFGGRSGINPNSYHNDMFVLELESMRWTNSQPEGKASALVGHSMTKVGEKLYIFGGKSGLWSHSNEVYVYDPKQDTIRTIKTKGPSPSGRQGHSAVAIDNKIYFYGGFDGTKRLNDLFVFDTETDTWSQIHATGIQPDRLDGHKAVALERKMYIFGGYNGTAFSGDVFAIDVEKKQWSSVAKGKPMAYHSANRIANLVYLIAGQNSKDRMNEVRVFDLESAEWLDQSTSGDTLPARQAHCGCTYGDKIIIFGGSASSHKVYLNDVFILNTITYEETAIPAPVATLSPEDAELSEQIDKTLKNARRLIDQKAHLATPNSIELVLPETIKKNEAASQIPNMAEKIRLWNEIGQLYANISEVKKDLTSHIAAVKRHLVSISGKQNDTAVLVSELERQEQDMRNTLAELERLEAAWKEAQSITTAAAQKHSQSKNRALSIEKQLKAAHIRIKEQEAHVDKLSKDAEDAQDKYNQAEKRKNEFANSSRKDAHDATTLQRELEDIEKDILKLENEERLLIERVAIAARNVTTLSIDLANLDDLDLEELRKMNEQLKRAVQAYISVEEMVLARLRQIDPENLPENDEIHLKNDSWIYDRIRAMRSLIASKLQAAKNEQQAMENQLKAIQNLIQIKKGTQKEFRAELTAINHRLERRTKEEGEIESELVKRKEDAIQASRAYEAAKSTIDAAKAQIKTEEAAFSQAQAEAEEDLRRFTAASSAETKAKRQFDEKRDSLFIKLEKLRKTYHETNEATGKVRSMRSEIEKLGAEYERRFTTFSDIGQRMKELEYKAEQELRDKIAKLQEQVDALKKQLDDCTIHGTATTSPDSALKKGRNAAETVDQIVKHELMDDNKL